MLSMKFINQLEPDELIRNFIQHPPEHFTAWIAKTGVPFFSTQFDLLTTAEPALATRIRKLPFYHKWKKLLTPITCFGGTTVSEYIPLTASVSPEEFSVKIKQDYVQHYPFLIVKDISQNSPLLSDYANHYSQELIESLKDVGFIEVEGQALAWVPIDFETTDEYLSRLSYSRRKDFRRKFKQRDKLTVTTLESGDPCFFEDHVLDRFYQMYLNVYEQSEIHFDLLTKPFFAHLLQQANNHAKIFCYYTEEKFIGYNICFVFNDMLIDKYIGFNYPDAREFNLYYVSWFYNLEYARKAGLKKYIAGWTDPKVKASLGASFTFTKHLVYVRNPLLRFILRKLTHRFENDHLLVNMPGK